MEHLKAEQVEWVLAPAKNFTGQVWFGPLSSQGTVNALAVRFEAEARTDWHSHPEGQVLYVVEGEAMVADEEGAKVRVEAGGVVYAPPGLLHWHGAGSAGPMQHLSITTGGETQWVSRKVINEEYRRSSPQ